MTKMSIILFTLFIQNRCGGLKHEAAKYTSIIIRTPKNIIDYPNFTSCFSTSYLCHP